MTQSLSSRLVHSCAIVASLAIGAGAAFAQAPKADNTKVNTRDRSKAEVTADQQKNNITDRKATQQIRQSLMRDKSLSTYAHNVKIVAVGGTVTLKGPVRSDAEKQTVEAKAVEVVGAGHVVNELSVAPPKSKNQ